jgi:hypothetical protein
MSVSGTKEQIDDDSINQTEARHALRMFDLEETHLANVQHSNESVTSWPYFVQSSMICSQLLACSQWLLAFLLVFRNHSVIKRLELKADFTK